MKLAIVGTRSFTNSKLINALLDKLHEKHTVTLVISGGAVGPDSIGEAWAKAHNINTRIFKPDWKTFGNKAGMLRNKDIVDSCNWLIAFWDGESHGTKNSIDLAMASIFVEHVFVVSIGGKVERLK